MALKNQNRQKIVDFTGDRGFTGDMLRPYISAVMVWANAAPLPLLPPYNFPKIIAICSIILTFILTICLNKYLNFLEILFLAIVGEGAQGLLHT